MSGNVFDEIDSRDKDAIKLAIMEQRSSCNSEALIKDILDRLDALEAKP